MLMRRIGIKITNATQRMLETGRKGTSKDSSLSPSGLWRNVTSKSNSPVVIVIVFNSERATLEKGERYTKSRT